MARSALARNSGVSSSCSSHASSPNRSCWRHIFVPSIGCCTLMLTVCCHTNFTGRTCVFSRRGRLSCQGHRFQLSAMAGSVARLRSSLANAMGTPTTVPGRVGRTPTGPAACPESHIKAPAQRRCYPVQAATARGWSCPRWRRLLSRSLQCGWKRIRELAFGGRSRPQSSQTRALIRLSSQRPRCQRLVRSRWAT